jgi:quercetin dioxygenase-like cupin family protein
MQRWHVPSVDASGKREPRVLFSAPQCRAVVIDLEAGDRLGEHSVHERAVVEVVSGRVSISAGGSGCECEAGTLVTFDPGERHSVEALEAARLLLMLAPWPGQGHYADGDRVGDPNRLPSNARADALEP